jgi:hypothetical protein
MRYDRDSPLLPFFSNYQLKAKKLRQKAEEDNDS